MREQIIDALEESLANAPEPADVLAGMRAGIARRHRRARIGAVVGLVALALVTSTVTAELSRHRDGPAAPPAQIPVGDWRSGIQVGWVPDGMSLYATSSRVTDEALSYRSGVASLTISLDKVDPSRDLDLPGWRRVDINGRQGREASQASQALVVFPLPSGRWVEVRYAQLDKVNQLSEAEYLVGAERVARSLGEDAAFPLRVGFAPSYLPGHQRIIGIFVIRAAPGFGAVECAVGSNRSAQLGPGVKISLEPQGQFQEGGARIADIQGRPAYLSPLGRRVLVHDFHGGVLRVEATMNGENVVVAPDLLPQDLLPTAELIKVAEGVRWIG